MRRRIYGEFMVPFLVLVQVVLLPECKPSSFSTRVLNAAENWGGTGTYADPFFYETVNVNGDGFGVTRGQTEIALGGLSIQQSLDRGFDLINGLRKNSYGFIQYRKSTVANLADMSTKVDVEAFDAILRVWPVNGADDNTVFRAAAIFSDRLLSQDWSRGNVKAEYKQQSLSAPFGADPAPIVNHHQFEFDYDGAVLPDGVWTLDLYGEVAGVTDVCESLNGDFNENDAVDLSQVGFTNWVSCLVNIAVATTAWELMDLVTQYPDPYLDFAFLPMDEEYIFEFRPII